MPPIDVAPAAGQTDDRSTTAEGFVCVRWIFGIFLLLDGGRNDRLDLVTLSGLHFICTIQRGCG